MNRNRAEVAQEQFAAVPTHLYLADRVLSGDRQQCDCFVMLLTWHHSMLSKSCPAICLLLTGADSGLCATLIPPWAMV